MPGVVIGDLFFVHFSLNRLRYAARAPIAIQVPPRNRKNFGARRNRRRSAQCKAIGERLGVHELCLLKFLIVTLELCSSPCSLEHQRLYGLLVTIILFFPVDFRCRMYHINNTIILRFAAQGSMLVTRICCSKRVYCPNNIRLVISVDFVDCFVKVAAVRAQKSSKLPTSPLKYADDCRRYGFAVEKKMKKTCIYRLSLLAFI